MYLYISNKHVKTTIMGNSSKNYLSWYLNKYFLLKQKTLMKEIKEVQKKTYYGH